jgi:hypothetical protein
MGSGEWGVKNGEWGVKNGEWGMEKRYYSPLPKLDDLLPHPALYAIKQQPEG